MPFVSAWLSATYNASAYNDDSACICHGGESPGDFCNYAGPNFIFCRPMGRPSAIVVSGHENDSVYDTEDIGQADSLTIYWYADQ